MSKETLDRFPILYESYAKGPEMKISAEKVKTILLTALGYRHDSTWESLENQTVPVGSNIEISGTLYTSAYVKVPGDKLINIYHKVGSGAYEKIGSPSTDAQSNIRFIYTLAQQGIHTFYAEFPGDDSYEGCAKKVLAEAR